MQAQETSESPRTVRVSGEATISVPPDEATVRFGIVTEAKTAEEARARNAEASKNAMNAVRALDVPESKMRMKSLRLQPRWEYNPKTEKREEKGYEANRQVVVELAELEQLPRLVTDVVQQGANRVEGIEYGLTERDSVRDQALKQAAQRARDKAELLAESVGATLGPVQEISEQEFGFNPPSPRMQVPFSKSAREDAAPEPDAYAGGEIEVKARVDVVFALE